ncbi:MAG: hypothetical protein LBS43_03785 [Prevotellaceae bacterium]|jgi:hypothetical protein|nr:hypothetical protein [Prevotellaceae bacterium]
MGNFDEILCRLIRNNRRVIIPDVGAFITNSSDESTVFSPLLKHNDGFLKDEMQKEGIANPANFLREFAENVISVIENGQHYRIAGLGYFFKDGSIKFVFETTDDADVYEHSDDIYLPEKKKNKNRARLVWGSILLCLPVVVGVVAIKIYGSKDLLKMFNSQTDKQFVIIDKSDNDFRAPENESGNLQASFQIKCYHVVAACFEEKSNAGNFVLQCRKIGCDKAEILSFTDAFYPVSIGKFTSLGEAMNKKQEYDKRFGENSLIISF